MKFLSFLILISPHVGLCQRPFQHANTQGFHYFTTAEIDSLELYDIYEVEKTKDTGGMGENLDLTHVYLSPADGYYSDNWHGFYDSSAVDPVIDTLVQFLDETFINGVEWQLEEGRLSSAGGHGYGTLSMNYYEYLDTIILINRMTRHSPTEELAVVTFYANGLPKEFIGWATIDMLEEDLDNTDEEFNLDFLSTTPDLDTTLYIYNEQLKLTSMKNLRTGEDYFDLFTPLEPQQPDLFHQCYIGLEPFEQRIQTITGHLPSLVVFEMSPLQVFAFKLDPTSKKYRFVQSYDLL